CQANSARNFLGYDVGAGAVAPQHRRGAVAVIDHACRRLGIDHEDVRGKGLHAREDVELGAEARASRVDVEGRRLDPERLGDGAGIRRDGARRAAAASYDHADIARPKARTREGLAGGEAPAFDVGVDSRFVGQTYVGVLRGPNVVEWQHGPALFDADPLQDPGV